MNAKVKPSLLHGIDMGSLRETTQRALGRKPDAVQTHASDDSSDLVALRLPLQNIEPDPNQPRRTLEAGENGQSLEDLAASILQHGVLQPITVQATENGRYQIVSGERRWRAAQIARDAGKPCARSGYDLTRIPAVVLPAVDGTQRLEMQLVENLAREDMRIEDIGAALRSLLAEGLSKAEIAQRLGRSHGWVNQVLAKTGPEVQALSQRLGRDVSGFGATEIQKLLLWSEDPEKSAWLDAAAAELAELAPGWPLTRKMLAEIEDRFRSEQSSPLSALPEKAVQEPTGDGEGIAPASASMAESVPTEPKTLARSSADSEEIAKKDVMHESPQSFVETPPSFMPSADVDGEDDGADSDDTDWDGGDDEPGQTIEPFLEQGGSNVGASLAGQREESSVSGSADPEFPSPQEQEERIRIALPQSVWRILLDQAGIAGPVTEENVRLAILGS